MSTISPSSEVVYEIGPSSPATNAGGTGRFARFRRGPETDPRWARPSLLAVLAAAAVLYLWDLGASGWANSFYAAAVQAGTKSWEAMLFGSLDAGNAITVDKPPAALWAMEVSGRIFGFNSWSMLAPQALMGVATCGVAYAAVKRVLTRTRGAALGAGAGLLAAVIVAVTPVAVLMFKFNNPDALLTLLLTLAVYAVVRAQENGSTRWLVLAGTLIGFAFLTKTLQAFLILPPLTLVYLSTGPGRFLRRLGQILAAGAAIVVSAGWWVALVQMTPASARPYVGGSQHNSFLELTFGYNGFGRITGNETGSVGGPRGGGLAEGGPGGTFTIPNGAIQITGGGPLPEFFRQGGGPGGGGGFGGSTGWNRLFSPEFGSQISWLIPAALLLLVLGLWAIGRANRTDHARAALLAWGLSLLSTMAVFSYMKGIIHPYYTIVLAPLIAVTAAIGAGLLWARRDELAPRVGLAAAIGAAAWWSFELLGRTPDWNPWLRSTTVGAGVVAAAALVFAPMVMTRRRAAADTADEELPAEEVSVSPLMKVVRWGAVAVGVGTALLGPAAYAVATTGTGHTGSIPSAGPSGSGLGFPGGGGFRVFGEGGNGFPGGMNGQFPGGGPNGQVPGGGQNGGQNGQMPGGSQTGQFPGRNQGGQTGQFPGGSQNGRMPGGMNNFLDATTPSAQIQSLLKQDAADYRWAAAAIGAQNAAGYQLSTGDPVMAIGGFNGSDPSPTLAQFQKYVADHKIHYFIGGGIGMQANGGADVGGDIGTWVKAHFTAQTIDNVTLYDLTAPTS